MPADENLTGETAAKKAEKWDSLAYFIGSIGDLLGGGWWLYSRPLKDSATGVEVRLITVKTAPLE